MNNVTIDYQDNELILNGALNQMTVEKALIDIIPLLPSQQSVKVNLLKVIDCDSSSWAFIMALLREAKKRSTQLTFIHMSKQMCDLGRLSGVYSLLSIE